MTSYILVDTRIRGIVSIFDDMSKAEDAKKKLILRDIILMKKIIDIRILMNESKDSVTDLGTLQMITFILDKPNDRLLSTNVPYYEGSSSLNRYVIYIKKLNQFNIDKANNTEVIILH
jgi:hypothetical protein